MKKYRQLVESLPSKTIVFALDEFCPLVAEHQSLVVFVKKLAAREKADHTIYALHTEQSCLSPERKLHYLNLVFPTTRFKIVESVDSVVYDLSRRYKNIIPVSSSKITNENFDSCFVVEDTKSKQFKMQKYAQKGMFEDFKRGLPATMREIDAKRLMNDVREGMGLEAIKEQIKLPTNDLRESYFRGEIYNVGEIVESAGKQYEIVKRGTNYLLVKDSDGKVESKWIHEVIQGNNND